MDRTCRHCGTPAAQAALFCTGCGAMLETAVDGPENEEIGHITYLLQQLPHMLNLGCLTRDAHDTLAQHYARRRTALVVQQEGGPAPQHDRAAPPAARPAHAASTAAPARIAVPPSAVPPQAAAAPASPAAQPGEWFGEFFRDHWLKLLALLAVALIVAGVRQFVAWDWVSEVALTLVPLLPIGAAATLYVVAERAEDTHSVGAFACRFVTVPLAMLAAFAVNKMWFAGAIVEPYALAFCLLAGVCTAAALLHTTGDTRFLHALAPAVAALAVAVVRIAGPPATSPADRGLAYGATLLAAAACLLLLSRGSRQAQQSAQDAADAQVYAAWAHLCAAASFAFALGPTVGTSAPKHVWAVLACGALLYGVSAQWTASEGQAWVAGVLSAASSAYFLWQVGNDVPYQWSYAALALAVIALTAERASVGAPGDPRQAGPARAYAAMAHMLAGVAGLSVLLPVAAGLATSTDWPLWAGALALSAALYGVLAAYRAQPWVLYAAAASALGASALATAFTLRAHVDDSTLVAALPFGVAAWLAAALLRSRGAREYSRPLWHAALASLAYTGAACSLPGTPAGRDASMWTGLVAATALLAAGAALHQRQARGAHAWAWALAGAAGAVSCVAWAAAAARVPALPSAALRGAVALTAASALAAGAAAAIKRTRPGAWLAPVGVASAMASVVATALVLSDAGSRVFGHQPVLALAAVLLVLVGANAWRGGGAWLALWPVLCAGELAMHFPGGAWPWAPLWCVCTAAAAAIAAGAAWWRLSHGSLVALAACSAALAGLAGSAAYPNAEAGAATAAGWAAAATMAGAAALLYRAARAGAGPASAVGAVLLLGGATVRATSLAADVPWEWWPAVMLPLYAAVYAAGHAARTDEERVGAPLRLTAGLISIGTLGAFLWLDVAMHGLDTPALTFQAALYAAAYGLAAFLRRTLAVAALAACTADVAVAHGVLAQDQTLAAAAAALAVTGLVWVAAAAAAERSAKSGEVARALFGAGCATAGAASVAALAGVMEPHQGPISLLALAVAGSAFAAAFALGRGEIYAHLGFTAFFAAYALAVYDSVGRQSMVVDLYLAPIGIYLLVVGSIASRRGRAESAGALWWLGLLTVMTPTFAAFFYGHVEGGSAWHGALLVLECAAAITWGIGNRIKAFVFCGAGFALAFSAVLASGAVQELWSGVVATAVGLCLALFVLYVSSSKERVTAWVARFSAEWDRWR